MKLKAETLHYSEMFVSFKIQLKLKFPKKDKI